jgi:hypothetical protein
MSYTSATYYLDYEGGSDAARTALTTVTVANPSGTITRATKAAHGLVTGMVVDLTLFSAWLNDAWKITVVDANTFDLDGAVWQATADNNGTATPRGGGSLADAWKTVTSGATNTRHQAGDTIRIKASPNPTSLGINGTWTDGPQQTTKAIVSSTNATPIVITLSGANYTALAPAVGDTVIVANHATNTKANGVWQISAVNGSTTITLQDAGGNDSVGNGIGGATGTVRKATNMAVKLASSVTRDVAVCGNQGQKANWTAATGNVTNTVITSDFKEGGECQQIAVGAAFTTGLAAYFPTGTLDLSGYQQLSFWIKQTAGTLGAASSLSLKLCSDTAGATPVNTFNLPALGSLNQWSPIVVDLAGALGSAIASVALYVNTDNAAQTFQFDNIIACKASSSADSLNLTSLISKNTGSEAWFGIQSINGTRVMLDGPTNTIPSTAPQRGYSGTTETVTTYKRETVKTAMVATVTAVQTIQLTAASGNPITYSGGWNRTDMSTQTGETWWDGQNGFGYALTDGGGARAYISVDKLNFTRYQTGCYISAGGSSYHTVGSMLACNCSSNPLSWSGPFVTATTLSVVQSGASLFTGPAGTTTTIARADGCTTSAGVTLGSASVTTTITQANNNNANGVVAGIGGYVGTISAANGNTQNGYTPDLNSTVGSLTANSNTSYGVKITAAVGCKILGGSTTGNSTAGVGITGTGGTVNLRNFTANEATPFQVVPTSAGGMIYSEKNGGVADAHLITADGGTIISATDQRNTASGISWKFRPTSTNRNSFYPLSLSVAKIACAANAAVTVKVYTRRDSTQIQGRLRVPGGQLAGVPSDVTVSCAPSINTWTQSSGLTFTPTEAGVVEVLFEVWDGTGTTNNFWIDDLSIA